MAYFCQHKIWHISEVSPCSGHHRLAMGKKKRRYRIKKVSLSESQGHLTHTTTVVGGPITSAHIVVDIRCT